MVRIRRGMDPGNTFTAPDEIQESRPPSCGYGRILIVQETSRRAVQKNSVILFKIIGGDARDVVSNRCSPQPAALPQSFYRLCSKRNGGMNEPARSCMWKHQHFAWAQRLYTWRRGQSSHHRIHLRARSSERRGVAGAVEGVDLTRLGRSWRRQ